MGNVIWWIGVLALALFFELCKRVGFRRSCSIIWTFAGEIGPRDAAERRRRWNWRLYGRRDAPPAPMMWGSWHGHDGSILCDNDGMPYPSRYRQDGELMDYPDTPVPSYREADDDTPVTWPIQKWSDRR